MTVSPDLTDAGDIETDSIIGEVVSAGGVTIVVTTVFKVFVFVCEFISVVPTVTEVTRLLDVMTDLTDVSVVLTMFTKSFNI